MGHRVASCPRSRKCALCLAGHCHCWGHRRGIPFVIKPSGFKHREQSGVKVSVEGKGGEHGCLPRGETWRPREAAGQAKSRAQDGQVTQKLVFPRKSTFSQLSCCAHPVSKTIVAPAPRGLLMCGSSWHCWKVGTACGGCLLTSPQREDSGAPLPKPQTSSHSLQRAPLY